VDRPWGAPPVTHAPQASSGDGRDRALRSARAPALAQIAAAEHTKGDRRWNIKRNGSRPSGKRPPRDMVHRPPCVSTRVFQVGDPLRVSGGQVTFEPGCPDHVAHPSAWPDADHHLGPRLGGRPKAGPLKRSGPAMSCGFRRARSTGTGATATTAMTPHRDHGILERQECRLGWRRSRNEQYRT